MMIGVGLSMLHKRRREGDTGMRLSRDTAAALLLRLVPMGLAAGFFGIGSGFLIVPSFNLATAMPFAYAFGRLLISDETLFERIFAILVIMAGIPCRGRGNVTLRHHEHPRCL